MAKNQINQRAAALKPSETLAIKAKAAELIAAGREVVDLSAGEPDIDTPEFIKQGAVEALRKGKTKYTAVAGINELREAIAAKLSSENGIPTNAESVIVANGGKQAIFETFAVTLEEGDEVIVPSPYWVSYPALVELCGAKAVIVETRACDGYKMSPGALKEKLSARTRFVIINSPSNPTGACYTVQEQRELAAVIAPTRSLVLSDEVYEKLLFDDFDFKSFAAACPELCDRTVTIQAFSKTYSMTGWRVGYASGPQDIVSAMIRYQSQISSNVNSIAQYAALEALRGPKDFLKELLAAYHQRLNQAMSIVSDIDGVTLPVKPQGAFYLFLRIDQIISEKRGGIANSAAFCDRLMETEGVAAVPGEAFGDSAAFRISISSSIENIERGLNRIKSFVNKLN
jgi:aspartate aminotransferase